MNLLVVSARQETLSKAAHEQLALMAIMYADIILEQSSFTQPGLQFRPHREDNLFFEALYKVKLPDPGPSENSPLVLLRLGRSFNRGLV